GPLPGDLGGLAEFLVVDEKERPVVSVISQPSEKLLRQHDWAAQTAAKLIEQHPVARRFAFLAVIGLLRCATDEPCLFVDWSAIAVVEPVVGIEPGVAVVLVETAMEFVIPTTGDELDLDRALAAALGPRGGG